MMLEDFESGLSSYGDIHQAFKLWTATPLSGQANLKIEHTATSDYRPVMFDKMHKMNRTGTFRFITRPGNVDNDSTFDSAIGVLRVFILSDGTPNNGYFVHLNGHITTTGLYKVISGSEVELFQTTGDAGGNSAIYEVILVFGIDGKITLTVKNSTYTYTNSTVDTTFSEGFFGIEGVPKAPLKGDGNYEIKHNIDDISYDGQVEIIDQEPPVSNPPAVTIVNISAPTADNTLSDEPNMDRANITFKFDQDVTEWRVRTVGTDPETGILADSGGAVAAGTEVTAEVDYTELYGEGQNRVNIYGKNADGQWTPYT